METMWREGPVASSSWLLKWSGPRSRPILQVGSVSGQRVPFRGADSQVGHHFGNVGYSDITTKMTLICHLPERT